MSAREGAATRAGLTAAKEERVLVAPSATTWGAIRHELLYINFALMEVALLTPVVMVILGWARYWPPLLMALWLLLFMLLPLNLIRLMGLLGVSLRRQRWVLIGALALSVLASWRLLLYTTGPPLDFGWMRRFADSLGEGGNLLWTRDLSIFLVTVFTWWRGIRLAVRQPEVNNVGLRLRLGGLIFLPLVIWFGSGSQAGSIVSFILLFFAAALTVISLVRAETIERERSGMAATLNARWFAVVALTALAIAASGGMLGALLAGDSLFVVMAWLAPLWRALQFAATVSGVLLFQVAYPLIEQLASLVQLLTEFLTAVFGQAAASLLGVTIEEGPLPTPTPTPDAAEGGLGTIFTPQLATSLIMLGLIALVALALTRAFRKATFTARESEHSRNIDAASSEGEGGGRRLLERLGLLRQWRAAASVRRIYRQMCAAAAAAGYPRSAAETPYEYLRALGRVWPGQTTDARAITEAFVRVRYGEVPETSDELEALRAAWRRLEAAAPKRHGDEGSPGPTLSKRE